MLFRCPRLHTELLQLRAFLFVPLPCVASDISLSTSMSVHPQGEGGFSVGFGAGLMIPSQADSFCNPCC